MSSDEDIANAPDIKKKAISNNEEDVTKAASTNASTCVKKCTNCDQPAFDDCVSKAKHATK